MMLDSGVIVACTLVAATAIIIYLWMKGKETSEAGRRFPPSAPILPLIDSILRGGIGVLPEHFMRTAEKLGPVMSYNFGGGRVIILDGREAISEAFLRQSETFADRTQFWTETNILNPDLRGIIFSRYNEPLKKYHKLSLAILKEFGFGVSSVTETRILREVESLNQKILKLNGRSIDLKPLTSVSTFSVVSGILFGEAFMMSDTCHRISEAVNRDALNISLATDLVPLLRFLPYFRKKISALEQAHKDIISGIKDGIEWSKLTGCESTFVGRFTEIQGPSYDHQDLMYIVRDLCIASAETVSSTLMWAMAELVNHPEVQTRFQREIDDVVPKDRFPSLDDRPRLPYTEAVILEVMRRHTIVPLYLPHATLKGAEVLGCYVPSGCIVIANAYSVQMDLKFWKDPQNFRPERFLDKENTITGSEHVIPFGIGRRSCLGEILARQEIFLFLTSLIQRFDFRPPEGQDVIRVKEVIAVGVFPSDFDVRLIRRIEK